MMISHVQWWKRFLVAVAFICLCCTAQICNAEADYPPAPPLPTELAQNAADDGVDSAAVDSTIGNVTDNTPATAPAILTSKETPATNAASSVADSSPAEPAVASPSVASAPITPATTTAAANNAASDNAQLASVANSIAPTTKPAAVSSSVSAPASQSLVWLDNYSQALDQAKAEKKLMLIHFFRPSDQQRPEANGADDSVVNVEKAFNQPKVRDKVSGYVLAKLPVDTKINLQGKTIRLLDHGAFSELHKGPGLALIDLTHEKAEYYSYVVSALPFTPGKYYRFRPSQIETLVALPEGTLTQRSMVFAVRIHPEHPASTSGQYNPVLLSEATAHSDYQAQIHVQGHQGWGERFQRIIGKLLGRGESGTPVEVVAESWPDQDLMDSCVDCVASWRQSPGHWEAVSAKQASYGYDIREGSNGIWYATGIFREAH